MSEVSEEEFQKYENVRHSGLTNMFMVNVVCDYSGLTREQVIYIIQNYRELCRKYPKVRTLEEKPE